MKNILMTRPILGIFSLIILFFIPTSVHAQTDSNQEQVYVKIEVKGLACPFCAYGLEKKLKKVKGVDNVEIDIKKGLAFVVTPLNQKPTQEELQKIITKAGFTPGEITFSNKSFIVIENE